MMRPAAHRPLDFSGGQIEGEHRIEMIVRRVAVRSPVLDAQLVRDGTE
jgi:hypothetical protein